nr:hypothetical protein [Streptomyces cahuitamycinicus]
MTSNNVTEAESVEPSEAAPAKSVDDQLIDELVGRAQAEGLQTRRTSHRFERSARAETYAQCW